ncbi:MAG: hypothetical protein HYV26_12990 [Candidatus Hydrogenedentes bacterium]|nr:hypothetical protein [Candidatus Hydrogenedentota bacterium]
MDMTDHHRPMKPRTAASLGAAIVACVSGGLVLGIHLVSAYLQSFRPLQEFFPFALGLTVLLSVFVYVPLRLLLYEPLQWFSASLSIGAFLVKFGTSLLLTLLFLVFLQIAAGPEFSILGAILFLLCAVYLFTLGTFRRPFARLRPALAPLDLILPLACFLAVIVNLEMASSWDSTVPVSLEDLRNSPQYTPFLAGGIEFRGGYLNYDWNEAKGLFDCSLSPEAYFASVEQEAGKHGWTVGDTDGFCKVYSRVDSTPGGYSHDEAVEVTFEPENQTVSIHIRAD